MGIIKTDHKWRPILTGDELPPKIWQEYREAINADTDENAGFYDDGFITYYGRYYHLSEFMVSGAEALPGDWDAMLSETAFNGIVIKLDSDGQQYKIGNVFS